MIDQYDLQGREDAIVVELKAGKKVSLEIAKEFAEAKTDLKLAVLADSYGGLLGPDSLSEQTDKATMRYENALIALERAVNI